MSFENWWHINMPNLVSGDEAGDQVIARATWEAAVNAERERCAKLCDEMVQNAKDWDSSYWDQAAAQLAIRIRAS